MKSLLSLWQRTATDAAVQCRTSATLDINRVERRFEHEGLELLTLSLPEIGKAFERSLDQGQVTDDLLSLTGQRAGFPQFLGNFLRLVFMRDGGRLLDNPSTEAIQAIRQLTLMFSKVGLPCTSAREAQAFVDYVKCEQELDYAIYEPSSADYRRLERISNMLFGDIFARLDREVYWGELVPKHGPGATADGLRGNAKYQQLEWTERLEGVFPALENILPSPRYHSSLDAVKFLDPGSERPVRVVSVPKTQKTPRIIAIEPTCMQYAQQAIMAGLVEYLENVDDESPILGMLGFTDQGPNQDLARDSSSSGELATLDLSEASDRVSVRLVRQILMNYGYLMEAVFASRSTRADVPGHGIVSLTKFASMGSALTFPMEEVAFLAIIFYGIEQSLNRRLTRKDVLSFRGRVRVYGDDIVIPVEFVPPVVDALELFGFKVNRNKSFWTGKFRESCGKEYYDGEDVSIFRVRQLLPAHRDDAPGVISLISLRNQAYWHGYWGTASYLDSIIEGLRLPFPIVRDSSPVHGRSSVLPFEGEREDPNLQIPLVRGVMTRARIPSSVVENEFALLKCLLKQGDEPFADSRHLERQGRPRVVDIKLGYGCPY